MVRTSGTATTHWAHLDQALAMHRRLGNRNSEAETLRILAVVHREIGRQEQALDLSDAALAATGESPYRRLRADALNTAGTIRLSLSQPSQAIEYRRQALAIIDHDRYPEADAHIGMANAYKYLGALERH